MRVVDSISSKPIDLPKTTRARDIRAITSCRAGKLVPHYMKMLLREDRVSRCDLTMTFDMSETVRPLMNAVAVKVMAHFVPFTAFARFPGVDGLNKSYQKLKDRVADAAPIPFFNTIAFDRTAPFWKSLGEHAPQGALVNDQYVEAYNVLVNWLREMRSKQLAARLLNDTSLAQAFWNHPFMYHIKPDFDQAMLDGEVALTLTGRAAVSGIGVATANTVVPSGPAAGTGDTFADPASYPLSLATAAAGAITLRVTGATAAAARADVWAELSGGTANGKVSLANIEMAKQTAAFAKLREQYKGRDDEDIIDLLMQGIRVPDEDLRQPILLASETTIFGYDENFATDGPNLSKSVTRGRTVVNLKFRTPEMNTGGVIVITSQIVPEQLFERMENPDLFVVDPALLPDALADYLDPEKVEVVQNRFVDVLHATPAGTFGYAPLNHKWKGSDMRVGGKFYRPVPDAFVEDRQRFWSVETPNPALNSAFYLVPTDLPHSVFADTLADCFEVTTIGTLQIVGLTQFGQVFEENDGNYAAVAAEVNPTRIVQ